MANTDGTDGSSPPEATACWICLEEGPDESGSNTVRGCACRGSAGFAHPSCLRDYAKRTMLTSVDKGEHPPDCNRWIVCPTCKTEYVGQVGLTMARGFLEEGRTWPEEHHIYASSLQMMAVALQREDHIPEAISRYAKLIRILRRTGDTLLLASVLKSLATCYVSQPNKQNDALRLYEESYELWVQLEGVEGRNAKSCRTMLSSLKAMLNQDLASMLRLQKEEVETFEERHGRDDKGGIHRRSSLLSLYIKCIQSGELAHLPEAKRFAEETLDMSNRLLGPDHGESVAIAQYSKMVQVLWNLHHKEGNVSHQTATIVGLANRPHLNGKTVEVLHSTKDGKYVVHLVTNGKTTKVKAPAEHFLLPPGASVTLDGLVSASELNGSRGEVTNFDEEKGQYSVLVSTEGGKKQVLLVKPVNCRIKK